MVRAVRGRGAGRMPPPLMSRNNGMPPIRPHPPRMMRPLLARGMRSPPFIPPIPPMPPIPPSHMRGLPPRLPPGPPLPPPPQHHPHRRNMPPMPFPPQRPPMMFPHPRGGMMGPPGPPMMGDPRGRRRIPPPLMGGRMQGPVNKPMRGRGKLRGKNFKNKIQKAIVEPNFYCKTCDRGFDAEEKYESHCEEHVTCGHEGCTLSASSQLIEKHIIMQHKTGLYMKIAKDSPEDIAKWIEDRKKNYPSKKNVLQNKEKLEEMEKRGERLHENKNKFGRTNRGSDKDYHSKTPRKHSWNDKEKTNKNAQKRPNSNRKKYKTVLEEEPEREDSWMCDLPHFPGTALFPLEESRTSEGEVEQFSDSEWETEKTAESEDCSSVTLSSSLAALSAAYCSGSESDLEQEKRGSELETVDKNIQMATSRTSFQDATVCSKTADTEIDDNDEPPEEVKIERRDTEIIKELEVDATTEKEKRLRKRKRPIKRASVCAPVKQARFMGPKRQPTLLEKLLGSEIRHERNVILQCVRFVVERNFLGEGQIS